MDETLRKFLRRRFCDITQRCKPYQSYGAKGIKNLFKSFDEFYHHVTISLGLDSYDKIRGLVIHRTKKHYEPDGIEFLTPAEHKAKHNGRDIPCELSQYIQ